MPKINSANDPLEFAQNLWGKMGFSLPGMVTPTFDVDELEKRLVDLKAVEGWLKMNLSMLQMTIQTLEMQCSTLNAVRAMGSIKPDPTPAAPSPVAGPAKAANETNTPAPDPYESAVWPWALMQQIQTQMQHSMEKQDEASAPTTKPGKKSS
ncbi:PhaM family polyhydroxyalkanoate granule multifunctional regulatory protein [Propionivibrio sp.]|uniref:PhaM family polyhydroxyalkanoate granule multifunctional regulatory protein n=1 Tax=Propionivibrio sp. TaxID=2212460 RepID=UPI002613251C|nr:PhaM family polyhydroxyalkanoate granule multifunctional regulatory protein [Propionivibrio sp.]